MPNITSIKQQQKISERFSLFVDGKFLMGIDGSLVIKYDLKPGDPFTPELQATLENDDRVEKAYMGLLNYIGFRERCEYEIHEWLYKKGLTDLEHQLISRLKERNYLDDSRFTRLFIRDRIKLRGWGPVRLKHELQKKRIDPAIIQANLAELTDESDFYESARELILKKQKLVARPGQKEKKRWFSFLQRKGYPAGIIRQVLDEIVFYYDDSEIS